MEVRQYGEMKVEVKEGIIKKREDVITHMMNFDRYSCKPLSVVENTSCAVNYRLCLVA